MEYWREKLNPFDAELQLMVESLTERPCELKNGGDGYFFEIDYSKHHEPEFISAVMDAVAGRLGKRLVDMKDDPDRKTVMVRARFSDEKYPGLVQSVAKTDPNPKKGMQFCHRLEQVTALQVKRDNADALIEFVGNGELEIPKDDPAVFHFLNASGSVWQHAPESSYIVLTKSEFFNVIDKDTFEAEYEPK